MMITNTGERVSDQRPGPRPRRPVRRTFQPATAWDDVDRTLLSTLTDRPLTAEKIAAAANWPLGLVRDQLIAYAARGLVVKDGQTGRYELADAGRNRLAEFAVRRG